MPTGPADKPSRYEFDGFTVDLEQDMLRRGDGIIDLPSRAFDALVYLIGHRDGSVPKDELIAAVWHDVIVTEDSLVHAISVLRRALGDERHDPKYIQTVPRRGYRFIAPVQVSSLPSQAGLTPESTQPIAAIGSSPALPAGTAYGVSALRSGWPVVVASVSLALIATLVWNALQNSPDTGNPTSVALYQPAPPDTDIVSAGALSPNGRYLAFAARDRTTGQTALWLRTLSSVELKRLDATDGAAMPFWSPDSRQIGYFASGELRAIDVNGDKPRTIAPAFAAAGASWGADDTILFAEWSSGLVAVPASGDGKPKTLLRLDSSAEDIAFAWPQFFGDNRRFLYRIVSLDPSRSGVYVGDRETLQSFRLLESSSSAVLAPPNHLLHVENGMLIAEEFDPEHAGLTGRASVVARGISATSLASENIVSASGDLLAFQQGDTSHNLAWYSRQGTKLETLRVPAELYNPRVSPDGSRLIGSSTVTTDPGLWLVSLDRDQYLRLATDAVGPIWSADGKRVAFTSRNGFDIFVLAVDKLGDQRQLTDGDSVRILNDWSADDRQLVYTQFQEGSDLDLWALDLESGIARPILATPHSETQARISPDGGWIAYASDESGEFQVYVARFPDLTDGQRISADGGSQPQWLSNQSELYYLAPDKSLMAVSVETEGPLRFGTPQALFRAAIAGEAGDARDHYAADVDGSRFLLAGESRENDGQAITIMVNWTSGFSEDRINPALVSQVIP